ncbi:uncharacterized protein LOC132798059 isoform X2 [Drosophila nasuta]|uniref:uncharacterized protein LOC132798059 isoform X2 n=1 Tax=Drosophila nasuta TaxID=42062 RepID=UPI00295EDA0C|nr:uncharacterized protein LOC132798059 isoform X2 [Drosophila nasuta]
MLTQQDQSEIDLLTAGWSALISRKSGEIDANKTKVTQLELEIRHLNRTKEDMQVKLMKKEEECILKDQRLSLAEEKIEYYEKKLNTTKRSPREGIISLECPFQNPRREHSASNRG